ncbi:MAG: hypothetical protein J6T10_30370 [Methanobrevibacter sp.]|nr:hypothetical protein [Methanobrevibacter sp.]
MSILSYITGRLPNLLETFQGTWKVEYRVQTDPPNEKTKGWFDGWDGFTTNASDLLVKAGQTYGLFPSTWQILDFTSFIEMNEVEDTSITSSPVEGGSFRSVNKVRKPKIIKVTLAKAGLGYGIQDSLAEVKKLLPLARYNVKKGVKQNITDALSDAWNSGVSALKSTFGFGSNEPSIKPKLKSVPMEFRVVTPYETIEHLNLIKLDYTFKQDTGRNMLLMYLTFQEIMERSVKSKKIAKNPTNTATSIVGKVNAQLPSDTDILIKAITG